MTGQIISQFDIREEKQIFSKNDNSWNRRRPGVNARRKHNLQQRQFVICGERIHVQYFFALTDKNADLGSERKMDDAKRVTYLEGHDNNTKQSESRIQMNGVRAD